MEWEADLADVVDAPLAVIYKHSPLCGLSSIAEDQVRAFQERHPDTPVYVIDVVRSRALARLVADRLAVRHESPQVIVIRDGAPVWSASHRGVTAEALAERAA